MSVLTHADNPRRYTARLGFAASSARRALVRIITRAVAPHRASISNLRAIPLTFSGTGCVDYAAFHLAGGWGWLVTGLSLVLLEHIIADDADVDDTSGNGSASSRL